MSVQPAPSASLRHRNGSAVAGGPVSLAVVGAGYWGPNLVRNAMQAAATRFMAVCDADARRAHRVAGAFGSVEAGNDLDNLDDAEVEAVAVATHAATHLDDNEGLLRSFHPMRGPDYVAMRYFSVCGRRMDVHGVYTEVLVRRMERIAHGKPPLIFGDGRQTIDFVFAEDIARTNHLAMASSATDRVSNIARGEETSLCGVADALLRVMCREDLEVEHGPGRAINGVTRRLADTPAACADRGFEADVDLEHGLRPLVAWWQAERHAAIDRSVACA